MPHIHNPTISGGFQQYTTTAGIAVDVQDPKKIGDCVFVAINNTQQRLDTTPLATAGGVSSYPMELELEAQFCGCWIKQGDSTITIPASHLKRIQTDEWQTVTVSGIGDAYFACLREPSSIAASGLLVATRIDSHY